MKKRVATSTLLATTASPTKRARIENYETNDDTTVIPQGLARSSSIRMFCYPATSVVQKTVTTTTSERRHSHHMVEREDERRDKELRDEWKHASANRDIPLQTLINVMRRRAMSCRARSTLRGVQSESLDWKQLVDRWYRQHQQSTPYTATRSPDLSTGTTCPVAICDACGYPMFLSSTLSVEKEASDDDCSSKPGESDVHSRAAGDDDSDNSRDECGLSTWLIVSVDRIDSSHPLLPYGPHNFRLVHRLCNMDKSLSDCTSQERRLSQSIEQRLGWVKSRVDRAATRSDSTDKSTETTFRRWTRLAARLTQLVHKTQTMIKWTSGVGSNFDPTSSLRGCVKCHVDKTVRSFPCKRLFLRHPSSELYGQIDLPRLVGAACYDCAPPNAVSTLPASTAGMTRLGSSSPSCSPQEPSSLIWRAYLFSLRLSIARQFISGQRAEQILEILPSWSTAKTFFSEQKTVCSLCLKPLQCDVRGDETDDGEYTMSVTIAFLASKWQWIHTGCRAPHPARARHLLEYQHARQTRLRLQERLERAVQRLHAAPCLVLREIGVQWECRCLASQYVAASHQLHEEMSRFQARWNQHLSTNVLQFESLNSRLLLVPIQTPRFKSMTVVDSKGIPTATDQTR